MGGKPRPRVPGLSQELPRSGRIVGQSLEVWIVSEGPRGQDAPRQSMPPEPNLRHDRLAIDRVGHCLAHTAVVERLGPRVEAVVAEVEHRPPHVVVPLTGDDLTVVSGRNRAVLEAAALELLEHLFQLGAGEDPIDEADQTRRAVEVVGIRGQHDLLASLPPDEPEGARPDRPATERLVLLLDEPRAGRSSRGRREDGHERHRAPPSGDADRVSVQGDQPGNLLALPLPELGSPRTPRKRSAKPDFVLGSQNPREREDDVVGGDLAPVMEPHALPEREGPGEAVAGGNPELGQRRRDVEGLVELDEAIEDLLGDSKTVHVPDAPGVECGRIITEGAAVGSPLLGR